MTKRNKKIEHGNRLALLQEFNELTEKPMIFLSFVWILLIILEFTAGISTLLEQISYGIWGIFIIDFLIEFLIAPNKLKYVKGNWITAISLLLPALRILRIFRGLRILRAARAIRSISLVRMVTSINRGIKTLRNVIGTRGIGYVFALTTLIIFAGAAGILFFENPNALAEDGHILRDNQTHITNYSDALWWTAMLMTTIGSEYWPRTVEGRILTFLLSLYALAIFGYITATIATLLIGRNSKR